MFSRLLCTAATFLVVGCGSFASDMKTICFAMESPELKAKLGDIAPDERQLVLAKYLSDNIRSQDARKLMEAMAVLATSKRKQLLATEAKKAGLGRCPLAE